MTKDNADARETATDLGRTIDDLLPALLEDLKSLVRIPSVAFASYDRADVRRSAAAVADLLRGAGVPEVEVLSVDDGSPAVVARRPAAPGKPTVLLYSHHDVQPEGDVADWEIDDPFSPVVKGDRLYGRGAADDKAGIMVHVGALRSMLEMTDLGISLFIEGEEEVGSPTFRAFIEAHHERLAADVIVVADSGNWKVGVPALTSSLRGVVDLDVEVRVLEHAVHSGMFGGPVLDALTCLSRLIATLHDDHGDVAVEGLVHAEQPEVEMDEADYRSDASVVEGAQLTGTGTITERLWSKPAISVIGIDAPSVATASNTLIPAATAKISLRIAPGQDPAAAMAALHEHLVKNAPFGVRVTVRDGQEGKPFLVDSDTPAAEAAHDALSEAWGTEAVSMGMGGSIPFIADLLEVFPGAQILVTGIEDPDTRAHSANESLHLGDFRNAVLAEALLLEKLNAGL